MLTFINNTYWTNKTINYPWYKLHNIAFFNNSKYAVVAQKPQPVIDKLFDNLNNEVYGI